MADRTKRILLTALLLGIAGDALFKGAGLGFNMALFGSSVAVVGVLVARSWFWVPFALFSAAFAFRDSAELRVANGTGMVLSAGAAMASASQTSIVVASVFDYTWRLLAALCTVPAAFASATWKHIGLDLNARVEFKRFAAPARGLILSLPFVAVFGLLFVSADARFEGWVQNLTQIDFDSFATHAFIVVGITMICGGLLLSIAHPRAKNDKLTYPFGFSITEAVTLLTIVNALFLVFVICQASYLFGSLPVGVTASEYARRGFFELVWVAGIVLTMIPLLRGLTGEQRFNAKLVGNICVLVLCVFAIIASAFWRMSLYVNAYGLTMLRLYTSAFMVWLLLTFLWLLVVLIRKDENRFAFGALVAGFACIMGLNAANPDALIAQTNLGVARSAADYETLSTLSADAIPVIEPHLSSFSAPGQAALLKAWKARCAETDWRATNLSLLAAAPRIADR